ncbi:hypothetical protein GHT06_005794 [Daphnia sinensis]|uniref:TonB-dependent receptor plug domain-containing protein n=1 Tax=Daphnia sinensis TaxID=1820382 RepID=A0AAD5KDX9_9CRUS|nr:hypothetical protein GHT06_005794 [Daphnia sinensis]
MVLAQINVSGKILDESGAGLPGATVLVKGTTTGSFVTGYGAQSKRDITGAVTTVATNDLLSMPATTFAQQLQGRAAGVNIVNDATPGGEATVRIRGFERCICGFIYGSRAANGVVIITTKRGKVGKPTISFNTYYGTQQADNAPEVLNAKELGQYLYLADLYAGKTPSHGQYTYGANGQVSIPDYVFPSAGKNGDPGTNPELYSLKPGNIYAITRSADTDWWKETTQTANIKNYQISAAGGTENGRYALSAGYSTKKYIGYERFSLRANTEFKALNSKLTIGENLSVTFDNRKGGFGNSDEQNAVSGAYKHHPLLPVYDIAGSRGANLGNNFNPYAVLKRAEDNRTYRLRVFGNAYASYDFSDNLQFKTSLGIDGNTSRGRFLGRPQPEYVEGNFINSTTARSDYQYQWVWSNVLSYNKTFNEVHNVDVYVGTEAITELASSSKQEDSVCFQYTRNLELLGSWRCYYSFQLRDYSLFSQFGKFNYSYADKYLIQVIVRNDASSRFLSASRNAIFPAFSLGWRLSEEDFIKSALPFVSDMKLRYGWGKTGNQAIGDYNAYTTYRSNIFNAGYPIDGSTSNPTLGFDAQRFGNPNAKWETTTSNNIGLDVLMFGDKIPITFTAGDAGAPSSNVGQITNKAGLPLSSYYGFNVEGIFQNQQEADAHATYGTYNAPDVNNDGEITDADRTVIGNPHPDFTYGVNAALYDAWQQSNPTAPKAQWVAANPGATAPIMDANDQNQKHPVDLYTSYHFAI